VRSAALGAILLAASAASTAHAGGLARPNAGSPTGAGMAGAWAAIADDAYALYVNPAGVAFAAPGGLASLELVVAPRNYVCEGDNCGLNGPDPDSPPIAGMDQKATAIAPVPVLGILFKPGGKDAPLTLGIAAYNSFGGILHWEPLENENIGVLNSSTEVVFEVAAGAGWAVDERFAIGAAVRLGVGLFAIDAQKKPVNTELSAVGIGVGVSAGVLWKPSDAVHVGVGWRSNLDVTTSGSGDLENIGTIDAEHVQKWPQSMSASVAYHASPRLVIAGQIDWTNWSRFETIDITFPGQDEGLGQHFLVDWNDTFAFRVGAQYQAGTKLQVRGGVLHDGSAVPDLTIERQYLDAPKFGLAAGMSYVLSKKLVLDVGIDAVGGPARNVPETDPTEVPSGWPHQRNLAPGDHSGSVFTLATGVRIAL